jgi:hypothetical protein
MFSTVSVRRLQRRSSCLSRQTLQFLIVERIGDAKQTLSVKSWNRYAYADLDRSVGAGVRLR